LTEPPDDASEPEDVEMLQTLDKARDRTGIPSHEARSMDSIAPEDQHTLDGAAGGKPRPRALGLASGQWLGAYRLVRVLGRGGFGEVWEAEDSVSGRHVAVKVLTEPHAREVDRQRFQREGRLAASVSHPNCVYVFTAEEIEGRPTIVMELVPGGTLQDVLKASGPLAMARAVDCALDVLDGLDAAHQRGVIHRDVKPSNCFVDAFGRVKIGDFGLSRTLEVDTHLTTTGMFAGTPAYASPEQVKGQELDFRTDLYSLGATLYCLLAGKAPFEGTQLGAVLSRILTESPRTFDAQGIAVPLGLERTIFRLMAKDRAQRFPSYAAARAALLPYSSRGLGPASLARRLAAVLVDSAVLTPFVMAVLWTTPNRLLAALVGIVYYVLLEGAWAKSLGKRAFRLEVTTADDREAGWGRIVLRTLVYTSGGVFSALLLPGFVTLWQRGGTRVGANLQQIGPLIWYAVLASTMRRRNGYAGLHEVLSGTRVRAIPEAERGERPGDQARVLMPVEVKAVGPYDVVGALWVRAGESLLVARDPVLGREVLVHRFDEAARRAPSVGPAALPWLQGGQGWNAYEMPGGASLWSWVRARGRLRYGEAQRVLMYVLEGLAADDRGPLSLTRVWVDALGRARRLDFDALDLPPAEQPGAFTAAEWGAFAKQVLVFTLEGRAMAGADLTARRLSVPLPEHARSIVSSIVSGRAESSSALVDALRRGTAHPSAVDTGRRAAALALPSFATFILATTVALVFLGTPFFAALLDLGRDVRIWQHVALHHPEAERDRDRVAAVEACLSYDYARAERLAVEVPAVFQPEIKLRDALAGLSADERAAFDDLRARRPSPTAEEAAAARTLLKLKPAQTEVRMLAFMLGAFAIPFPGLGILLAFALRGGLGLRVGGISVQRGDGEPASRLRCLWRALVAWSPLAVVAALGVATFIRPALPASGLLAGAALAGAVLGLGAAYALRHPSRGLQDRLVGTVLMPR
jgi:hypothetical protein